MYTFNYLQLKTHNVFFDYTIYYLISSDQEGQYRGKDKRHHTHDTVQDKFHQNQDTHRPQCSHLFNKSFYWSFIYFFFQDYFKTK